MKHTKKHYFKTAHTIYASLRYLDDKFLNECFEDYCELSDYIIDGDNAKDEDGDIVLTKEQYIEIFREDDMCLFQEWMGYCDNPYDFFVTGQLGLWNCRPTIVPKRFHTLKDAIYACINGVDYIEVELCPKCIKVNATHHDGTNCFELRMMNKGAQNMYDNCPCGMEDEVLEKIAANEKWHHTLFQEMFGFCL